MLTRQDVKYYSEFDATFQLYQASLQLVARSEGKLLPQN